MTALWVRALLRRPRRAVSAVLVLVLLTVATTASLVAGEALARLFREDAVAEWGAVDVEGRSADGPFLSDGAARRLSVEAGDLVAAAAPRLVLRAVAGSDSRREPQALVLGLGAEERGFPVLRAVAGEDRVGALAKDEAILNARLAERLGVGVGDRVRLDVAVPQWPEHVAGSEVPRVHRARGVALALRVAGVVADTGAADLHRTPNALLRREVLQEAAGLSPAQSTALHLDVREGQAPPGDRAAAEAVIRQVAGEAQRLGVVLEPVKADALDRAAEEGGLLRSILLTLALLVLLAATGAVAELLAVLALDRAREVAVLRAVGVPRVRLRRLLVAEALVLAAVGIVGGVALAVPAGGRLARALSDHFATLESGRGREQVALTTGVDVVPVLVGAAVVALAAVVASRAAAGRVLAADLDALLRGEAAATSQAPRGVTRPVVALVAGAWLLGAGATAPVGGDALRYLGLTLVLAAAWLRARRRAADVRVTDTRWAVGALVWSVAGAAALGDFAQGVQAGFGVLATAGTVAVVAAAWLVVPSLRVAVRRVRARWLRGRPDVALLVGAAWTSAERDRAALRTATVGAALFAAAALSVLGSAQALPVERQAGGFDVIGTAVTGVDTARLERTPGAQVVVALPHAVLPEGAYATEREEDGPQVSVPYPVRVVGLSDALTVTQSFGLAAALPEHRTAADALRAVARTDDKAVVDRYALPEGAQPGDDVVLDVRGVERRLHLVAVLDTYLLGGVLVSSSAFDDLATRSGDTLVLAAGPGDRAELARSLEVAAGPAGLDARTVDALRADVIRVNRTFTDVFVVVLLLALAVVVVSVAAATSRAVRHRRRELGLLLALGARRRTVVAALVVEPVLSAGVGAVIGLAAGLAVLRLLFAVGYSSLAFVLDPGRLVAVALGTVGLVALTSAVAARSAGRGGAAASLHDLV